MKYRDIGIGMVVMLLSSNRFAYKQTYRQEEEANGAILTGTEIVPTFISPEAEVKPVSWGRMGTSVSWF